MNDEELCNGLEQSKGCLVEIQIDETQEQYGIAMKMGGKTDK